jgi:hypothetical protein
MHLRLIIHPKEADSLLCHLDEQGFSPARVGAGELEVLFPGEPSIFPAAADLDLWQARGGCVASLVIRPCERRREPLAT